MARWQRWDAVVGFVAVLLALASPCAALDPAKTIGQYNRDVWTTVQGLPQGSVLAIAQTRDGYLWFGTRAGLARFDGARFTLFEPSSTPGLAGRVIQSLEAAPDGSLWMGTDGKGIARYDGEFHAAGAHLGMSGDSGNSLYLDERGVLWAGTWAGVVAYDGRKAERFTVRSGLPHDAVFAVGGDGQGTVWAATGAGLAEIRGGRITPRRDPSLVEPQCLLFDRAGTLWIGTASGLARIAGGTLRRLTTADGLLADFVTSLVEDRDGSIWIGTEGGLNRWSHGRIDGYSAVDGLPGNSVASLMEDRDGSLWVGLRGMGVVRFREGGLTTYTRREGLAGDNVTCIFGSQEGSLLIGTTDGLTEIGKGRTRVFTKRDGLLNESITGLGDAPGGGVLIATYAKRLNLLRNGRISVWPELEIASTIPSVIHRDRSGTLWLGTLGAGLYRQRGAHVEHFPFSDGAGRSSIYGVHEDDDGVLWFATPNGLTRYEDEAFSQIEVYRQGPNAGVALAVHGDAAGNLWVATRDRGLCRLRAGVQSCYGRAEGLLDDTVLGILEDRTARLFLSTPRGICVVARGDLDAFDRGEVRRLRALSLGVQDGMQTAECAGQRWPTVFAGSDGRLWFATAKGAVVADPRRSLAAAPSPPVLIERLRIDGRVFASSGAVEAPPGRGELEVGYAGLAFRAPELVRFRHRLDGFDRDWVEAGGRRSARYTNLPPGHYTFRVSASEEGGPWSEHDATLRLVLRPHFYETRSWYAALLVAGATLVWFVYRLRERRLRRQAQDLARRVKEALAEVKVLSGLIPICANCKRIRSDQGYWEQIEAYIRAHSEARFTHGICPECIRLLYPEHADQVLGTLSDAEP